MLTQKEDGNFYLEDGTFAVKVSFSQLEHVEDDGFFTEMCVVMAEGKYDENLFYAKSIMHPPLHANKAQKFQLNEQDYFGSYTKLTETLMIKGKITEIEKG